jgi:hypothetical protein
MWSKGICWIDDCRIPYTKGDVDKINFDRPRVRELKEDRDWILTQAHDFTNPDYKEYNTDGRFPANILVSDDMLNDGVISKSTIFDGKLPNIKGGRFGANDVELTNERALGGYNDKGTNSRYYDIDKWFDKILDV